MIKRIIPFVLTLALGLGIVCLLRAGNREAAGARNDIPSIETPSLVSRPCEGDNRTELSIVFNPAAEYTTVAREKGITGRVRLYAYVAGSQLDDISVVQPLTADLNAKAVKAAKRIRLKPATECGRPLVQPVELEYDFPSNCEARLIRL